MATDYFLENPTGSPLLLPEDHKVRFYSKMKHFVVKIDSQCVACRTRGSGFIVAPGLVLTCAHCVSAHNHQVPIVRVGKWGVEGILTEAITVGYDGSLDMALPLVDEWKEDPNYVRFGPYRVGMSAYNISHGFGLNYTMPTGKIANPTNMSNDDLNATLSGEFDYRSRRADTNERPLIHILNSHVKPEASESPCSIFENSDFAITTSACEFFIQQTSNLVESNLESAISQARGNCLSMCQV